jgi:hypothetical protein
MGSTCGFRWRKSSFSSSGGDCVEVGAGWRKSSFSGGNGECVELSRAGAVRDSKNPGGPMIRTDLGVLVCAVKAGRLGH